jgi:hypothetical protein
MHVFQQLPHLYSSTVSVSWLATRLEDPLDTAKTETPDHILAQYALLRAGSRKSALVKNP